MEVYIANSSTGSMNACRARSKLSLTEKMTRPGLSVQKSAPSVSSPKKKVRLHIPLSCPTEPPGSVSVLKVPGSTIDVDLWISSVDPGKSVDTGFRTKAMKGIATFSFNASGEGTDLVLSAHGTTLPLLGWLMYSMIRMDFPKREKDRLALVKRMAESGELDPANAEAAPKIE